MENTILWKVRLTWSYKLPKIGVRFNSKRFIYSTFDEVYVQDATDNSKYNGYGDKLHNETTVEVFLGTPRSFNLGLSVNF